MIEIRACAADFARIVAAENAQNPGFRQYGLVLSAAIRIGATTNAPDHLELAIVDEQADVTDYFRNRNLATMLLKRTNLNPETGH